MLKLVTWKWWLIAWLLVVQSAPALLCAVPSSASGLQGTVKKSGAHVSATKRFFRQHEKIRSAAVGAGVGTAAGALAGLLTGKGVVRGAAIGAAAEPV